MGCSVRGNPFIFIRLLLFLAYAEELLELPRKVGVLHNAVYLLGTCAVEIYWNKSRCVAASTEVIADTTLWEGEVGLAAWD